jgi:hypothetical protein
LWYGVLPRHSSAQAIDLPPFGRVGVGHKPEAISSVGRVDGTSRDNGSPAGVVDAFQVRMHSVEPILSNRSRNLFSHDDMGPLGTDEVEEDWPEVTLVCFPFAFSCR